MKQVKKIILVGIIGLLTLTGCQISEHVFKRDDAGADGNITVAVPVPLEFAQQNTKFLQGIKLAQEEINEKGINGKKVDLRIVDDQADFRTAVELAQDFISQKDSIVAVIGHWYSDICLPIARLYEDAQLLNIVPTVSNPELTEEGYEFVFQSITSDKRIAEAMCAFAKSKGYERVVVYYEDTSYGKNLARAIDEEAARIGLTVIDRRSELVTSEQFQLAYDKWKALEFQAVLLALNMPEGAEFISRLRQADEKIAVLGADGLDVADFIPSLGQDAEGTVLFTTYKPDDSSYNLNGFMAKFQAKYNEQPDVWAIQGYESLQLIVHGVEATGSYSSGVLAQYLHQMEPWQSLSGMISFNESGEILGRKIYAKQVVEGQFQYLD